MKASNQWTIVVVVVGGRQGKGIFAVFAVALIKGIRKGFQGDFYVRNVAEPFSLVLIWIVMETYVTWG